MRLLKRPHLSPAAAGLAAAIAMVLATVACSLPKRYYPVPEESIRDLPVLNRYVKRIGIAAFADLSGTARGDLVKSVETTLSAAIDRNCGEVAVILSTAADAPAFLKIDPQMDKGAADTFTMAQTARRSGFQMIVRGRLLSLNHRVDRSGWARFRESHHFLDLRLQAEAVNAITAAKIAQHSETITLPVDEETGAAIDAGERFDLPELAEALTDVSIDLALKLCISIRAHPWETVIRTVRGGDMVLAAAPAAALQPGDRLAVFDGRRTITGYDGERFILPGFRQGTVVVAAESGGELLVTGEAGGVFPVGSILVPVR
jgi:hypothetical protein